MSRDVFIHESAFVDEGAIIGKGTKVWHFCHVMSGAEIGENCILGQNVFIGGRAKIGNNVRIQNNVSVYDMVTIEDSVFCGPSMVFTNVMNPRAEIRRGIVYGTIMASYAVEDFSVKKLASIHYSDVQKRYHNYRQLTRY